MTDTTVTPDIQMRALKEWAIDRMSTGTSTPWAWFQFMKLLEVLDTFLEAGEDAGMSPGQTEIMDDEDVDMPMPANVVPFTVRPRRSMAGLDEAEA